VPDPDTKFMVQQMFNRYLEPGQSIVSITEYMKTIGLRTKWGRPYVKSNIQAILTNPFYVGVNRFNGNDYPGAQEHLISKTLFRQVQQKMHKGRPDRLRSHNSPLKGLIRCEDCGSMVTWQASAVALVMRASEISYLGRTESRNSLEGCLTD
jgi:site-specific DNA recombinase